MVLLTFCFGFAHFSYDGDICRSQRINLWRHVCRKIS